MAKEGTRKYRLAYALGDLVMSSIAMVLYNIFRYYAQIDTIGSMQGFHSVGLFLTSATVMIGQICFPVAMLGIYWISGYYNEIYRKSVLQEIVTTLMSAFMSTMLVFFVALINDSTSDHYRNYEMLLALWFILFVCIYPVRLAITLSIKRRIARSEIEFPALIIGTGSNARKFADELNRLKSKLGYKIIGYVSTHECKEVAGDPALLPTFNIKDINSVCKQHDIKELIIVPPPHQDINNILQTFNILLPLNIPIKVISNAVDLFLSRGKLATMYGTPLIDLSCSNMSECETNMKRTADIVFSFIALLILLPVFIIIALTIKIKYGGPVIFKQKRMGLHGKLFTIYKFRTMVVDAEKNGKPQLTTHDDSRVLPLGHIMRKYRIDELPQFWNVLRGDMSIVGPRPERKYFVDRIMEYAPHYTMLLQVRPGITSFGMVKYGYASSIEEMIKRMRYDIIYMENISLITDFKIIMYTIWTVVTGKGL